jgi:hypothetical protein
VPTYQPIIIIGAARSGTKLLRDVIAAHSDIAKVPYDINYIWRMGNEKVAHDELTSEMLRTENQTRIRADLAKYAHGFPYLVEKTVSNCLRVPYVQAILPDARFIHLVRDGRDVIESVHRQWTAPPDWRYIVQKARSFPWRQAFGYGLNYGLGTLRKLLSSRDTGRATTWGPRYNGIDRDLKQKDIWEVCAIQWLRCIESALQSLSHVASVQQMNIRYEEFVCQPEMYLTQIAAFLEIDPVPYQTILSEYEISGDNVGKGLSRMPKPQLSLIRPHLERGLTLLDYA